MKQLIFLLIFLFSLQAIAQEEKPEYTEGGSTVEMADEMRADGKIYVVVGVILLILGGLIFYVYGVDRKISKLEREITQKIDS